MCMHARAMLCETVEKCVSRAFQLKERRMANVNLSANSCARALNCDIFDSNGREKFPMWEDQIFGSEFIKMNKKKKREKKIGLFEIIFEMSCGVIQTLQLRRLDYSGNKRGRNTFHISEELLNGCNRNETHQPNLSISTINW